MKIAVLAPMYVPAHKAGGPVPGIVGVVESLAEHEVHVFASDRDLGESVPFPPPHTGTTQVGTAMVTYLPPLGSRWFGGLRAWLGALREVRRSELVYANSLMSTKFTVFPLLLLWLSRFDGQLVVSPRGELATSALRLGGSRQKRFWILVIRRLGLDVRVGHGSVTWVASTDHESADIARALPRAHVVVVPERLRATQSPVRVSAAPAGGLEMISVGRLAPVKGHDRLLRALAQALLPVHLRIIGLAEDARYVARLELIVRTLPPHVHVSFDGALPPDEVERALVGAQLFVLLTHGESFGHAIGEALRAGCPVLISDQTAWSDVADAGAGVVLNEAECDDPRRVAREIDRFAAMSDDEWKACSRRAGEYLARLEHPVTLLEAMAAARNRRG